MSLSHVYREGKLLSIERILSSFFVSKCCWSPWQGRGKRPEKKNKCKTVSDLFRAFKNPFSERFYPFSYPQLNESKNAVVIPIRIGS